ncbi:hypothetical protein D3C78_1109440 [compost metagenome]
MDSSLIGKIFKAVKYTQDHIGHLIFVQHICRLMHQAVNFAFGQAIDLAQLPEDASSLERAHCAHQCGMRSFVFGKNIFIDIIPFVPGEINIKIRW